MKTPDHPAPHRGTREDEIRWLRIEVAKAYANVETCERNLAAAKAAAKAARAGAAAVPVDGNLLARPGFVEGLKLIRAQNRLLSLEVKLERLCELAGESFVQIVAGRARAAFVEGASDGDA